MPAAKVIVQTCRGCSESPCCNQLAFACWRTEHSRRANTKRLTAQEWTVVPKTTADEGMKGFRPVTAHAHVDCVVLARQQHCCCTLLHCCRNEICA